MLDKWLATSSGVAHPSESSNVGSRPINSSEIHLPNFDDIEAQNSLLVGKIDQNRVLDGGREGTQVMAPTALADVTNSRGTWEMISETTDFHAYETSHLQHCQEAVLLESSSGD